MLQRNSMNGLCYPPGYPCPPAVGPAYPYWNGASANMLIDKMIGNAYQTVSFVACNMSAIQYVARNMEDIHALATEVRATKVVKQTAGELGSVNNVPMPEGITLDDIVGSSVVLVSTDGSLFDATSGHFSVTVTSVGLVLNLGMGAPAGLAEGEIRWLISYAPPEETV